MSLLHHTTIGTVQSVDFVFTATANFHIFFAVTATAKYPHFYHTYSKSNSTINSNVFLGNVQILFDFDVFHQD